MVGVVYWYCYLNAGYNPGLNSAADLMHALAKMYCKLLDIFFLQKKLRILQSISVSEGKRLVFHWQVGSEGI